jgi:hypothetical protein
VKAFYNEFKRLKGQHPDAVLVFYYGAGSVDLLAQDAITATLVAPACVVGRINVNVGASQLVPSDAASAVMAHWNNGELVHRLRLAGYAVAVCTTGTPIDDVPELHDPRPLTLSRTEIDVETSTQGAKS